MAALIAAWGAAQAAGAGFSAAKAKAKVPKCHRQAAFDLAVAPQADPGQAVDLEITVFKRSKCFAKPSKCTVLFDAPDGAVLPLSLQGLAEEAIVNANFTQYYAWPLANLSATRRGMYKGKKRMATVYTLPVGADLCAPPAALPFAVSLVVKRKRQSTSKKSSGWGRKGKQPRPGKRCTKTFQVSVRPRLRLVDDTGCACVLRPPPLSLPIHFPRRRTTLIHALPHRLPCPGGWPSPWTAPSRSRATCWGARPASQGAAALPASSATTAGS